MEKWNSKKIKRGQALLGRPASLLAQPSRTAWPPLPSLPRADARIAPPSAGHVTAVRRRRGRAAGRSSYPGRDGTPCPQAPFCPPPAPLSLLPPCSRSGSSRSGAPPCAIGTAAQLPTPVTRARLNPPPAPPRRALPRTHALHRPRQGNRWDSTAATWPEHRRALGPRGSSLPDLLSLCLMARFGRRTPVNPKRPDAGEQRHQAPPCAITAARDLLRRRELA